jgi:hypothetical protein
MALLATSAASAVRAVPAVAASTQQAMFEDDDALAADPLGTIDQLRMLGVARMRVVAYWVNYPPNAESRRLPKRFNGSDPASYPSANWTALDGIVQDAQQAGMGIDLNPMGPAPVWALGSGRPKNAGNQNWEPSPRLYQQFVHALGVRYSGSYNPVLKRVTPGDPRDLPRVSFWSIWNEPDYGPSLAPQGVPGHLTIENSPRMYRNLVDAGWRALHQTGHARDTVIWGELAPRGQSYWGVFSGMKPLVFLRAMYCVDSSYRPLTGTAAGLRGCPTTVAGRRRFRSLNPGLFQASGVSDHPYMRWYPPNREQNPDPTNGSSTVDYSSLGVIGNLTRALDRLQRVYGSRTRFPIYNTEFGYITTPPKHDNQHENTPPYRYPWVTQSTAASYLNWAEYISWKNPRMASFFQYLLYDPEAPAANNDWGGYASGLLTYNHKPKPGFAAWKLPLYLPKTSGRRGQKLEVWGCLRPARYAILDTGQSQTVSIQFRARTGAPWQTVRTVTFSRASQSCYFDVRMRFQSSGTVRLGWSYPIDDPSLGYFDPLQPHSVHSRSVKITLS